MTVKLAVKKCSEIAKISSVSVLSLYFERPRTNSNKMRKPEIKQKAKIPLCAPIGNVGNEADIPAIQIARTANVPTYLSK